VKFTTTLEVPLTIEQLAGLFADLDDDSQAKFFVEAARLLGSQHEIVAQMDRPVPRTDAERALDHFLEGKPMSEFSP
jgi:hypothetical protein